MDEMSLIICKHLLSAYYILSMIFIATENIKHEELTVYAIKIQSFSSVIYRDNPVKGVVWYGGVMKGQSGVEINSNQRAFIRKDFKEFPFELYLEE